MAPRLGFSLPESKFHPPAARTGVVARTALIERLATTQAPIISVTAPPGYGKTTLLAQWAERIGPRVAWLSCDDRDNDPVVLLSALAVALDRIGPVDPAIVSALASPEADISVVPRFMSAVASVRPPVTVLLDHAEAVAGRLGAWRGRRQHRAGLSRGSRYAPGRSRSWRARPAHRRS